MLPGPRHGYDLKRAYDEWFIGLRPLAFGQVYSTLARLQRDGQIQVAHTETGEGPERVVYELTALGRDQALSWLHEPVDPGGVVGDDLIRKTLAAYRLNIDPQGLMGRQRTAHLRAIRALEPAGAGGGGSGLSLRPVAIAGALLADHQRLHLDADLRWLENATELIRAQSPAIADPLPVHLPPQPDRGDEPEQAPQPADADAVPDAADEGARS
jgi:DNA-binding PadR family transcriptional regulator